LAGRPTAHSHQPADRQDQPSAGSQQQNHRLTNSILRLAVAQLAASISDLITRVKRTGCPFERTSFYSRESSAWRTPHTWRSLGAKIPRPAFEGIEEHRNFSRKRRPYLGHPGRDHINLGELTDLLFGRMDGTGGELDPTADRLGEGRTRVARGRQWQRVRGSTHES
jgi:hypothetical protein